MPRKSGNVLQGKGENVSFNPYPEWGEGSTGREGGIDLGWNIPAENAAGIPLQIPKVTLRGPHPGTLRLNYIYNKYSCRSRDSKSL